jgi:minor extracellular protease Epr
MRLKPSVRWILFPALALLVGGASRAQLLPPVPNVGGVLGGVGDVASGALDRTTATVDNVRAAARQLAESRADRLSALVRRFPERLEMTDLGPAVRGEVVALDPDPATLAAVQRAGFVPVGEDVIEGLDMRSVTLRVPEDWSVDRALSRLRRIAPAGEFAANHLHIQSGSTAAAAAGGTTAALAQGGAARGPAIGMIDGGVAAHPALRGAIEQRGFATGAPRPSAHGTAVASLIAGQGSVRGAAPGARLLVADVYGTDPAGGNAVALVRALGWLVQSRVPVVAISLVGPANRLVARAIAQAQARGLHVVAAVGNDGPAAPPAYPASYPGVIAVTGVDARNRVIIEAGRASHLDYAAPGADMAAARAGGNLMPVRGTSYAVPFVAGRLAQHVRSGRPLAALDAEAVGRGRRGLGRGVVCSDCRTPYRRN